MTRVVQVPPTRLDKLPTELLEEIITHLVKAERDREWTSNDQSRRQGDHLRPVTSTSKCAEATSSTRKWKISALGLLPVLSHVSIVRRWIYPTPVYDPQYADILHYRLTNRRAAAAALRSFVEHIETHPWDFKPGAWTESLICFSTKRSQPELHVCGSTAFASQPTIRAITLDLQHLLGTKKLAPSTSA
jgi:hypothetical protein